MGRTHRAINTTLVLPISFGTLQLAHWSPVQAFIFGAGYCFATFFMNPDLDLNSIGYHSWGPLRIIWWPYQKALAHRSYLSHFPVISTILRLIYLMWLPVILIWLLGSSVQAAARETVFDWWPILGIPLMIFILGMTLSDAIHTILDVSSTDLKRMVSRHPSHHETFWEHNLRGSHSHSRRRRHPRRR